VATAVAEAGRRAAPTARIGGGSRLALPLHQLRPTPELAMSISRRSVAALLCLALAPAACATMGDEDPGVVTADQLGQADYVDAVFTMVSGGACARSITYDASDRTLIVERGAVSRSATLEWSHDDATNEYLADPAYVSAIVDGPCVGDLDLETMQIVTPDVDWTRPTSGCGGKLADLRAHFDAMADAYAPDLVCYGATTR
jgi:hypothetical protein